MRATFKDGKATLFPTQFFTCTFLGIFVFQETVKKDLLIVVIRNSLTFVPEDIGYLFVIKLFHVVLRYVSK